MDGLLRCPSEQKDVKPMFKISGSSEAESKCKKHKKHSRYKLKRRAKKRGLYVSITPCAGSRVSPPNSETERINSDILSIAESVTKKVLRPELTSDVSDLELFLTPTKKPVQCPISRVCSARVTQRLQCWMPESGCAIKNKMGKRKPHAMSDSDSEHAEQRTEVQSNKKSKRPSDSKVSTNIEITPEIPSGCPEGMTAHTFTSDNTTCWLEDVTADGKELWLVKVPDNFEADVLDGIQVQLDGAVKLPVTTKTTDLQYEALSKSMNKEMGSLCVLLPSHKRSALCIAPELVRQVEIVQTLPGEGTTLPSPVRPKNLTLPEGLKYRNVPYGADSPERVVDVLSPERKVLKKKLKKALGTSFSSPKRRKGDDVKNNGTDLAGVSKDGKKKQSKNTIVLKEEVSERIANRIATEDEQSVGIGKRVEKKKDKKKRKKDKSSVDVQNITHEIMDTNPLADLSGNKKKKKKKKVCDEVLKAKAETGDTCDGHKAKKKKCKKQA